MTEFGELYLPLWLRGRIVIFALALIVALAIEVSQPGPLFPLLALLIGVNFVASLALPTLTRRYDRGRVIFFALAGDVVLNCATIFYLGQIINGFLMIYVIVALNALLLLGRPALLRIAVLCGLGIVAQLALEFSGLSLAPRILPPPVQTVGQVFILAAIFYVIFLLARANAMMLAHWRSEKETAESARTLAEHQQQQWALINAVALRIQAATTPAQVYATIGAELERLAMHSVILEWVEPNIALRIAYTSLAPNVLQELLGQLQVELETFQLSVEGKPVVTQVLATHAPVYVENAAETIKRALTHNPDSFTENSLAPLGLKHVVFAPMLVGDTTSGILAVFGNALVENDLPAIAALAQQAASALDKARLLTEQEKRAAQLALVGEIAAHAGAFSDPDEIVRAMVQAVQERFGYHHVCLSLYDARKNEMEQRAAAGPNAHLYCLGHRWSAAAGLVGLAARTRQTVYSGDIANDVRYLPDPDCAANSALCVPMISGKNVLGVLDIESQAHNAFDVNDIRALETLANQMAAALEKAQLVNALQERVHAQQILTELSATLLATTMPQTILDQAADAALRALETESARIFLLQEDGMLRAQAHAGFVPEELLEIQLAPDYTSTSGTAFTAGQAVWWSDSEPASMTHIRPLIVELGFRAGLAVPMMLSEHIVGVIVVNTRRERQYTETDAQTLALLANQTASTLERARYFDQVQRRAGELNLLFEGFRATASTLEPEQVIARLLDQLLDAFDLTSAYYIQFDSLGTELTQAYAAFSDAANAQERWGPRGAKLDALPELRDILRQRPNLTNAADPQLSSPMRKFMQKNGAHTILRVPLITSDQVTGYLSLWDTCAPREWTTEQIRFVQTMATQAAAALSNAQLYQAAQTRTRELQALYEASHLINSTLDVRTICENSVDSLRDILGYQHVSIYFLENNALHMQVQRGYDAPFVVLPLNRGIIARAVSTRNPIFLPDAMPEPGYLAALDDVQSEIAVPLIAGTRVLGALNVETRKSEAAAPQRAQLTEADVKLLTTFANQLVGAIENARLFEETQQRLFQVRMLHAAAQTVSADLKFDAVLERVADQFIAALNVDSCTISEVDLPRREMITLLDRDPLTPVRAEPGTRFPFLLTDDQSNHHSTAQAKAYRLDDPNLTPMERDLLEKFHWRAFVLAPLVARGEIVGYVELGERKHLRSFDASELQLVESLANQATIAIQNARLYRDAQQRLQETETMYHFARELGGTLDIQTLGKRALEAAGRLCDFDLGEVSLQREADGALVPMAMMGHPDLLSKDLTLPHEVGIMGWVMEHGHAVRVGNVTEDPRYHALSPHIMSEICLPLRIGQRTIGVLNLEAKAPDAFDEHVEQLLTAFANQLAIAIENARLYEQTKRDAEVKAALLRELSHRVKNNLAAITSLLYMALDEPSETREQILNETLGRVQSMSLAHALLARSGEAHVNLLDLGRRVLQDTVRNLAQPGALVNIECQGDEVRVGARQMTTLALVLNELATNALRHGLNGQSAPHFILRYVVQQFDQEVGFQLQDNGRGLEDTFDVITDAGLGLNLVRTLVEKDLHGHFVLVRRGLWTCADIRFQLEEDVV